MDSDGAMSYDELEWYRKGQADGLSGDESGWVLIKLFNCTAYAIIYQEGYIDGRNQAIIRGVPRKPVENRLQYPF